MAEVELQVDDGVAVITLNAPERRNAFVPAMVHELLAICDQVDADAGDAEDVTERLSGGE